MVIPSDQIRFFSEHIARLPHCYLPNDDAQPVAAEAPRRADLGLPGNAFVFCALHNTYKLNPPVFDVWMRLLRDTPGSVLWLRGGEEVMRSNLAARGALARGSCAGAARVRRAAALDGESSGAVPASRFPFLDALPYGGHATARDDLWAGLPVLTCARGVFASRVSASQLCALDLPELVTSSLEEYGTRALGAGSAFAGPARGAAPTIGGSQENAAGVRDGSIPQTPRKRLTGRWRNGSAAAMRRKASVSLQFGEARERPNERRIIAPALDG